GPRFQFVAPRISTARVRHRSGRKNGAAVASGAPRACTRRKKRLARGRSSALVNGLAPLTVIPREPEPLHRLWDKLSEFPLADIDQALAHLFESVGALIGADDGFWLGTVRVLHGAVAKGD